LTLPSQREQTSDESTHSRFLRPERTPAANGYRGFFLPYLPAKMVGSGVERRTVKSHRHPSYRAAAVVARTSASAFQRPSSVSRLYVSVLLPGTKFPQDSSLRPYDLVCQKTECRVWDYAHLLSKSFDKRIRRCRFAGLTAIRPRGQARSAPTGSGERAWSCLDAAYVAGAFAVTPNSGRSLGPFLIHVLRNIHRTL
jgi:hypothetical protein